MRPGRKASRETAGLGRSPQRDDLSCANGMTQCFINKGDSGILRIPEESHHRLLKDVPPFNSGMMQEALQSKS
jgi:hypothetical protein